MRDSIPTATNDWAPVGETIEGRYRLGGVVGDIGYSDISESRTSSSLVAGRMGYYFGDSSWTASCDRAGPAGCTWFSRGKLKRSSASCSG
jgi:hypothetical protein